MKKVLTITTALLLALPAFADDAKKAEPQKTTSTAQPAATATVLDGAPATANSTDSPLVAASKRANRKGKKATNVITNESIKKPSGAHVTTSHTTPAPLPRVPADLPSEEELRIRQATQRQIADKVAADEAAKKKEATAKQRRLAAAAGAAESDYVDPAEAEHQLAEAAREAKEKEKKPPQR